jgi:hypothetical protein
MGDETACVNRLDLRIEFSEDARTAAIDLSDATGLYRNVRIEAVQGER